MSVFYDQVLKANIFIQPLLFILIVVTNILKIRILSSRALRISQCSHYLTSYAIFSIIYTCLLCPTQVIRALYIGWEDTPIGCHIYFFALFTPPYLSRAMLILASFDRYCSGSKLQRLNLTSTKRATHKTIILTTILIIVYMSPMSFIYYYDTTTAACRQYTNFLVNVFVFSQVIVYYTLAPILMIIFGILTIMNIHQYAFIRTTLQSYSTHGRRTERQLARMLLLQICSHLILTTPFGVLYFMNAFNPATRTPNIIAIRYICVMWTQCDYFLSFFLYILSGSGYRNELRRLLKLNEP
ncbi:unnamed protein product [Adineta ricciae]|uniref:G-protein coupled receptors family 1 profile domain-containing protein n=1 Tax=Adineta ricciae TaxID=249248 RepID=A0A814X4F4_ADIRI|nr:unnamed protein product [Adineta ricciae]